MRGRKAQQFCQHESHLSMRKKQFRTAGKNQNSPQTRRKPSKSGTRGPHTRPHRETTRQGEKRPQATRSGSIRLPRGAVLIWGRHAAEAVLANSARRISALYLTEEGAQWLAEQHHQHDLPAPVIMDRAELDHALAVTLDGDEKTVHQGVVLVAQPLAAPGLEEWLETPLENRPVVILLDQITDSRNIGAIMRSARAFGAQAMITTDRHCPEENAIMLRAASGAAEHIPLIRVTNLARAMETLKDHGFTLAAMTADGNSSITQLAEEDRLGLVMGAEGKGLRRLTLENSDLLVSIDIDPAAESLNVSTAAAIGLFAAGRRR